jgi:hypothetical protein
MRRTIQGNIPCKELFREIFPEKNYSGKYPLRRTIQGNIS